MQALEFWKTVTVDRANLLESLITLLNEHGVKYCVIDGQAVNAYAERWSAWIWISVSRWSTWPRQSVYLRTILR